MQKHKDDSQVQYNPLISYVPQFNIIPHIRFIFKNLKKRSELNSLTNNFIISLFKFNVS